MKNLLVFMSIAIFAISLNGCRKKAEMAGEPEAALPVEPTAAVTEEAQAKQEAPAVAEQATAQPEKVAVVAEEAVVQEQTPAAVAEETALETVVVTVYGQNITEKEISEEVDKRIGAMKKRMPGG